MPDWLTTVFALSAGVVAVAGAVAVGQRMVGAIRRRRTRPTQFLRTPVLGLQFLQGGTPVPMYAAGFRHVRVPLRPEPFELTAELPSPDVGVKLRAWTDESVFDLENDVPWAETVFAPGHGMAAGYYGDGNLMLDHDGFDFLAGQRLEKAGDGVYKAYFASPWIAGEAGSFRQYDTLFLAVVVERTPSLVVTNESFEFIHLEFG
jgi:hypothetical protein